MEYCFDDILLLPRYSELESRKSPNISTKIGNIELGIPLISSPMDTITEHEMAATMHKSGGLGILTRYVGKNTWDSVILQEYQLKKSISKHISTPHNTLNIGIAIGLNDHRIIENLIGILDLKKNPNYSIEFVVCIDVAHADHKKVHQVIREINKIRKDNKFVLMVGNVCTYNATLSLADLGVDAIRVGIGSGSICSTRLVTGFGRPQLSAIQDCARVKKLYPNIAIISDGGCRRTDHVIKALWAGADAVMLGYMFANSSACPKINGERIYRGMSSHEASGRTDIASEGVRIPVKDKGNTGELLQKYISGIKAGLAMAGARNIEELRRCEFVHVSPLSIKETNPYLEG